MLGQAGMGFGLLGLASLMADEGLLNRAEAATQNPLTPKRPHFPAKAQRVVHLFMNGGPSQVDTFDPKPALDKYHGKTLPGPNLQTERKTGAAMRSPFKFARYGKSGIEVSDFSAARRRTSTTCASSAR